jgi:hypothetical protein
VPSQPPQLAVIACAVLENEVRHFAQDMPHVRHVEILPQGLHNEPTRLQRELQVVVTRLESRSDIEAIALVYGLCSRGVENLRHARCPIVIARAHDCVTLYLGSKERYADYIARHPGTYWYTPGWIAAATPPGPEREAKLRREFTERFGAEEADYLLEMERQWVANYSRAAYAGLGVGETARDMDYTRHCAACLGWEFDQVAGDPALLRDLLGGPWDEERFLVVPPHHGIQLVADASVVRSVPLPPEPATVINPGNEPT